MIPSSTRRRRDGEDFMDMIDQQYLKWNWYTQMDTYLRDSALPLKASSAIGFRSIFRQLTRQLFFLINRLKQYF
jgi:hypothetical protein